MSILSFIVHRRVLCTLYHVCDAVLASLKVINHSNLSKPLTKIQRHPCQERHGCRYFVSTSECMQLRLYMSVLQHTCHSTPEDQFLSATAISSARVKQAHPHFARRSVIGLVPVETTLHFEKIVRIMLHQYNNDLNVSDPLRDALAQHVLDHLNNVLLTQWNDVFCTF